MDCNREEALRAKQLAEKKMEIKDFYGALKIAVKAQQLCPELENVSQMILVCEVHCSAEKKSYGPDKDWYAVLKIDPTADEISIKKQYRKLALVLHPDKNKFAGATDAFKLIGEAQRVLLDREKRVNYDTKRRAYGNVSGPNLNPRPPSKQPSVHQQHPWHQGGRSGNFQFPQQPPAGGSRLTFWTVCPFCSVRYQFYRDDVLNKVIHCQSCKRSFTAFELNPQGGTTAAASSTTQTRQHPLYNNNSKAAPGPARTYTTKPVFEKKEAQKSQKSEGNTNRKRKKRIEESSESSDSESSSESEEEVEDVVNNPDFEKFGEQPRRSSRAKRDVSYKENHNETEVENENGNDNNNNDDATPSTEPKVENEKKKENLNNKKTREDDNKDGETASDDDDEEEEIEEEEEEETETKLFECPDPEFTKFGDDVTEENFKAGQIWACYDTTDAMPRFYAYIKKVELKRFKLTIQWLKPDPGSPDEVNWAREKLPVSCGTFKPERPDKIEDLLSFSHLVSWEAGKKKGQKMTYIITPRIGEIWALFKNWSIKWDASSSTKFEYEFVEILSDFNEKDGVRVSNMEKVKGFVCLFKQKEGGEMVIPGSDKYRFSHMIPSCKMSGEEKVGVPKGSYEVDPASLPPSIFERVKL